MLTALRAVMGWKQDHLAHVLKTNQSSVSRWESGAAPVPDDVKAKIIATAKSLECYADIKRMSLERKLWPLSHDLMEVIEDRRCSVMQSPTSCLGANKKQIVDAKCASEIDFIDSLKNGMMHNQEDWDMHERCPDGSMFSENFVACAYTRHLKTKDGIFVRNSRVNIRATSLMDGTRAILALGVDISEEQALGEFKDSKIITAEDVSNFFEIS